jgi:hypothetical protein
MTISYDFLVDWDGNGFFCKDALLTDAPNLIPNAASIGDWKRRVTGTGGGAGVFDGDGLTDYGVELITWVTGGDAGASLEFLFDGTNLDVSITPGLVYTVVLWVRITDASAANVTFEARSNPGPVTMATTSTTIPVGATYTQLTLTFTAPVGSTNVYLYLAKTAAAASYNFYVAGGMVVQASAAPSVFNAGVISLYENITQWVLDAVWSVGFQSPFQHIADMERATLTLDNETKLFSPEYSSGALYGYLKTQRKTLIYASTGSVAETTMFTGWLKLIEPDPKTSGSKTARLEVYGIRQFIDRVKVNVPLQLDATALEIIEAILDELNLPVSGADTGVIPRGGTSDTDTVTYPYAADNWTSVDALTALTDVAKARQAKVLFDRSANLVFLKPEVFVGGTAIITTLNNSMTGMKYEWGGVINQVSVKSYERTLSPNSDDILWSSGNETIRLVYQETKILDVEYFQPDTNAKVAGLNAYLDITASGGTLTTSIDAGAKKARITLQHLYTDNHKLDITASSVLVRGKKLTAFGEAESIARDTDSIEEHGEIGLSIDAKTMNTPAEANDIAHYNLARFKDPFATIRSVTFIAGVSEAMEDLAIEYGAPQIVSDESAAHRIRLIENQTGHDSYHTIVGESHHLFENKHTVTWYLEPVVGAMRLDDAGFGALDSMFLGIE